MTSPRPKGGDSPGHPGGFLLLRQQPPHAHTRAGLTPAPQASTASPAARASPRSRPGHGPRRRGRSTPARSTTSSRTPRRSNTPSTRGTTGRRRPARGRTTGIVLHHAPEFPPRRVRDGAGQPVVADHVANGSPRSRPFGFHGRVESSACAGDHACGRRSAHASGRPCGGPWPGSRPALLPGQPRCACASRHGPDVHDGDWRPSPRWRGVSR